MVQYISYRISHTGDTMLIGFCRYMRYLIGQQTNGQPVYWICQVNSGACINAFLLGVLNTLAFASLFADLVPDFVGPYNLVIIQLMLLVYREGTIGL